MESLEDFAREFDRLSRLLDGTLSFLKQQIRAHAEADAAYKKARAEAWLRCPTDPPGTKAGERDWTADRRAAWVDAETAEQGMERDIAKGMVDAAKEAVQAKRTQISALKAMLGARQEEASFDRTVPRGA